MNLLLTAATLFEIQPSLDYIQSNNGVVNDHTWEILITGVGQLACAYQLTATLSRKQTDMVIQAGLAGSFSSKYPPGEVVMVGEEILGDVGAMEKESFSDLFDLQLARMDEFPFTGNRLVNPLKKEFPPDSPPFVRGITVNEISSTSERIRLLKEKYNPDIETMEGAALHYVCLEERVDFLQLRAISNFAGIRNKAEWKITEAIERLNLKLINIIENIA